MNTPTTLLHLDPDRDAWERQPGESGPAFNAFAAYRDAGPTRSVREVYRQRPGHEKATHASGSWLGWMRRNRWSERAEAYDRYLDKRTRVEREERARVANERHERFGRALQDRALRSINGLPYEADVLAQDGTRLKITLQPLSPHQARLYLQTGIEMERKALGIPDRVAAEISGAAGGPLETRVVGIELVMPTTREELKRMPTSDLMDLYRQLAQGTSPDAATPHAA